MISVCHVLVIASTCAYVVICVPSHGSGGHIDDSPQARMIFQLADKSNDTHLTYDEFKQVFADFDTDGNGNVTTTEFLTLWIADQLGESPQGVILFTNLDVNGDGVIEDNIDMPYIFIFFDRNADYSITEGEFVIQWVKISS